MIVHCTAVCIALNKELEHSDNGDLVVIEKSGHSWHGVIEFVNNC